MILEHLVVNPERILKFRGYTLLSGIIHFLAKSWMKDNGKLRRILENLVSNTGGS